ncbi:MAG: SRPBCC family protein [Desulfobacterales bacterium]|nr:SRPBCC family protein [Desulfobacterales bacterium]
MAFTLTIKINKEFNVRGDYEKVFNVLSTVPVSASHFPNVDKVEEIGDNTFRWDMEKIGIDKYYFQTVYACKYTSNKEEGWVKWIPVQEIGNALLKGEWNISKKNDGTNIKFYTEGDLSFPFPSIAKFIISPIITKKFEGFINKYIENLTNTFNS